MKAYHEANFQGEFSIVFLARENSQSNAQNIHSIQYSNRSDLKKQSQKRTRRRKALTGPSSESFNSSSSNSIQSSNLKINIVPSKTTKSISNLRSCELKTKIEVKLVPVHKVYGPKISVEIFFFSQAAHQHKPNSLQTDPIMNKTLLSNRFQLKNL